MFYQIERIAGIEPASPTWKDGVISHYTIFANFCTPNESRTHNLRIRSALLYPIELWVQMRLGGLPDSKDSHSFVKPIFRTGL
jgi:hypothetical protein